MKHNYPTPHKEFFTFIYERMKDVHNENPNLEFMLSFKERIDDLFGTDRKQEFMDMLGRKKDELFNETVKLMFSDDIGTNDKMYKLHETIGKVDMLKEIIEEAKKLEED